MNALIDSLYDAATDASRWPQAREAIQKHAMTDSAVQCGLRWRMFGPAEVDVGRREVVDALTVADVILDIAHLLCGGKTLSN